MQNDMFTLLHTASVWFLLKSFSRRITYWKKKHLTVGAFYLSQVVKKQKHQTSLLNNYHLSFLRWEILVHDILFFFLISLFSSFWKQVQLLCLPLCMHLGLQSEMISPTFAPSELFCYGQQTTQKSSVKTKISGDVPWNHNHHNY